MSERPPAASQLATDLPGLTAYITGHDAATGDTAIVLERPAVWQSIDKDGMGFYLPYTTSKFPPSMKDDQDIAQHDARLSSGKLGIVNPGGTVLRCVDFAPGFESMMHRTQSLDFGIVIEGSIELILDSGRKQVLQRGDICVQRGTNHAWRNPHGTQWARVIYEQVELISPACTPSITICRTARNSLIMADPVLRLQIPPLSATPFAGKVVAITGGSSGIGLATVILLWSRGASIAVAGISSRGVQEIEAEVKARSATALPGQKFSAKIVDVSKDNAVRAWTNYIMAEFGRLDYAANVAGIVHNYGLMAETTVTDFDASFNNNTRGVYNCMRAQIPHMCRGSSIVNVSSIIGTQPEPGVSLYGASKAAINLLTAAAASEYGVNGIRVNAVAPGVTLSARLMEYAQEYIGPGVASTALKRGAEPLEIAYTIAFLLSDRSQLCYRNCADGGRRIACNQV
ncbi:hypothetical protein LTS10_012545 [Elasticomyces elasticus]|nr:hypothetical protein LTS10_012545 [Elasticomyces elasticus]